MDLIAHDGPRRVQKYKRTLRPERRAVAEFIYHYHGKRNHQGLGNAFVFLDTTASPGRVTGDGQSESHSKGRWSPSLLHSTRRCLSRSARDGYGTSRQLTPIPLSRADADPRNVLHEDDPSILVAGSSLISRSSSLWKGQLPVLRTKSIRR